MSASTGDGFDLGNVVCSHHWVIASPNGPTSVGVCKLCGVEREFRNSLPGGGWERDAAELKTREDLVKQTQTTN